MPTRKLIIRAMLAAGIFLPAGCGLVVITDGTVDPQEPLPAAAVVIGSQANGSGFLIDRGERLVVTSASLVRADAPNPIEVVFPTLENGKIKVKRDYLLHHAPRVKATVVANNRNSEGDLVVLRLDGDVPESAVELKLAAGGCQAGEHVRLVGTVDRPSLIWGAAESTVESVGEQKLTFAGDQKVVTRMAQLEAAGSLGKPSRGGPVINDAGEVIAVISGSAGEPPRLFTVDGRELRSFLGIVYSHLARSAIRSDDCKKAIVLCEKALALNPSYALAYNERGAALSYLDRYDDAIASYTTALKFDPKLALAYRNRGSAFLHKGDYQRAVEDCTEAIKLDRNYASAYDTRKKAYMKLNRLAEARADEEQLRELNKINWKTTSPFPENWFPNSPPAPG